MVRLGLFFVDLRDNAHWQSGVPRIILAPLISWLYLILFTIIALRVPWKATCVYG
jgi:hypothetical protein